PARRLERGIALRPDRRVGRRRLLPRRARAPAAPPPPRRTRRFREMTRARAADSAGRTAGVTGRNRGSTRSRPWLALTGSWSRALGGLPGERDLTPSRGAPTIPRLPWPPSLLRRVAVRRP